MSVRSSALAVALLSSTAVLAADQVRVNDPAPFTGPASGAPGHWSVATGETVSPGRDALSFELGWPGVSFGYLHGLSDRADVGVKFDLLYAFENTTSSHLGFGLGVPLRLVVNRREKLLIGLHFDPGLRVYTQGGSADLVMRLPVGAVLGIQATPELRIAATADLNLGVQLLHTAFLEVGPQFGFAVEYFVDRNLLVGLSMKFGPQFYSFAGSNAEFAFSTLVVVGYRL